MSDALLNQKERQIGQLSAQKESQIAAHVREQERLAAEIGRLVDESHQCLMRERAAYFALAAQAHVVVAAKRKELDEAVAAGRKEQIGRASCRERV